MKIRWDLNSAPVSDATSGVLNIDDGGVKRQIPLTGDQVRFGSLLYSPESAQVTVQLTTLKNDQSTAQGSILVLLKKPAQPQRTDGGAPPAAPFEVRTEPVKALRKFVPPAGKSPTETANAP